MGEEVSRDRYTSEDQERYRQAVERDMELLRSMVADGAFEHANAKAGMEIEINLVDRDFEPALNNASVLDSIDDPQFVPELGLFNIELNLEPRQLGPEGLRQFERAIFSTLDDAAQRAETRGALLAVIGILPTIGLEHLSEEALSDNNRFAALNRMMRERRGEPFDLDLEGTEPLRLSSESILPEAACTSHQLHLQVSLDSFAACWNASQAIAGIQLALGANSPFFCGHRLVAETRVPVFAAATDTRNAEERAADALPRVLFGRKWIGSVLDLFEENLQYPAVLPELSETDDNPQPGEVPKLRALNLLNGTIYRWNRPIYGYGAKAPHLRVENRVLPAGPSAIDMVANAAFHAGLVRALAEQEHAIWYETEFATARRNFYAGVRDGIEATQVWPGLGEVSIPGLVERTLLPLAASGLQAWGVAGEETARYLGVIEQRAAAGINGAAWQTAAVGRREAAGESRKQALRGMLKDYIAQMSENKPVHTWEV